MQMIFFVFAALTLVSAVPRTVDHVAAAAPAVATVATSNGTFHPGFTWCYDRNLSGKCVNASTVNDACVNINSATANMPDNDQASSARTNFNSMCTLHSAVDCVGTASLTIQPETAFDDFSVNNFDNVMSSYRCSFKYPGFTWCYDTDLQGECVTAATEDGVCVNINSATVNMPNNDQASSAMANPRSKCMLYAAVNCLQKELVLQPGSRNNDFSTAGFDNVMSSYKCTFLTV